MQYLTRQRIKRGSTEKEAMVKEEEEEEEEEEEKGDHRHQQQHTMDGEREKPRGEERDDDPLPLMALNHVSRLCKSVDNSVEFYTKVLGFVLINRPPSLNFNGAWLFNYGVGIHLVQKEEGKHSTDATPDRLDPMDNHISFQCEDMNALERRLKAMKIKYMKRTINEEEGSPIDQIFFNDPDGFMIEICNCENLELVPAGSMGHIKLPKDRHNPPLLMSNSDHN